VVTGVVNGLGQLLDGDVRRGNYQGFPRSRGRDIVTGAARLQLQLVDLRRKRTEKSLESCAAPSSDVSPYSLRSCNPARHRVSVTRSIEPGQPQIAHVAPAARKPISWSAAGRASAGNGPAMSPAREPLRLPTGPGPRPTG